MQEIAQEYKERIAEFQAKIDEAQKALAELETPHDEKKPAKDAPAAETATPAE